MPLPQAPAARRAVVLLSGGLDSATTAAIALNEGYDLVALTIDYGQRHRIELEAAGRIADWLQIPRLVQRIDLRQFGASALTTSADVPKGRSDAEIGSGIPSTYVPARNTVFLSLALALAEARSIGEIFVGVNAIDYSGYPDCRPEFLAAFESLANLATKAGVEGTIQFRIHAPLIAMSKAQIIRRGHELGVPFDLTNSCYDPADDGRPCGACDACVLRRQGFEAAGIVDQAVLRASMHNTSFPAAAFTPGLSPRGRGEQDERGGRRPES